MQFVRTAIVVCSLITVSSAVIADDSVKSLADQLMDRSNATYKVAKRIPLEFSPRTSVLTLTAEVQEIATRVRYADDPVIEDVELLIEKLGKLETVNADLKELAEENDDDETMEKSAKIGSLIGKMRLLSERLRATMQ